MHWLCIRFPDLSLEALAAPVDKPAAIIEVAGNKKRLLALNDLALKRGLQPGMSLPSALGLLPELVTYPRNPVAEDDALHSAACWAYRFGSPVTVSSHQKAVWVEVGNSLELFGGWWNLAAAVRNAKADLPRRMYFGAAPTMRCAYLLTFSEAGLDAPILRARDIPHILGPLPIRLLPLPYDARKLLHEVGLKTISEVLAIPTDSLTRRIGKEPFNDLQRLLGKATETWESFEPPQSYCRRFEFAEPTDHTEALLFPLKMMLGEFANYLCSRDVTVQQFSLRLIDSRKRVRVYPIGLMSATRNPARLLLILKEQVDRIELDDGVIEMALEAERFEPATAIQDDLFGSAANLCERFTELRERLAARLGVDAVRQIAVSPDQRPEHSMSEPTTGSRINPVPGTHHPSRPLWLLPQPRRLIPRQLLSPPERLELGWWDGTQQARDYHLAEDESGRVCWVYREPGSVDWYLHGLWQ